MKKLGFAVMIFATTITLALPTFADPTTNQNQPTKQESGVMLKGLEATLKNVDTVQSVIKLWNVTPSSRAPQALSPPEPWRHRGDGACRHPARRQRD